MLQLKRNLLPGCSFRPWLREGKTPLFGNERKDVRGRVRVNLGLGHPHANSAGWQYRYRLVVAYALELELDPRDHVDHLDGVIDHDELRNLRLLAAEMHGQYHAFLFELAGKRDRRGQFCIPEPLDRVTIPAFRAGPVISTRPINADWMPQSKELSNV